MVHLNVSRVRPNCEDIPLPAYATDHSAGLDLCAAITTELAIAPGSRALIPTSFAIALPEGFEAQVRPRSGLALRHGLTVLNAPGTIDADYRGEIQVILANLGADHVTICRGDRIAQLVVARYERSELHIVEHLEETLRGVGGFGHTGVSMERAGEGKTTTDE